MSGKKPLLIGLVVALLIAGGLYFFMCNKSGVVSSDLDSQAISALKTADKAAIEARLLAAINISLDGFEMKASSAEVSLDKLTILYKNISIKLPGQLITVDEILEEGVAPGILLGTYGPNDATSRITLKNVNVISEGMTANIPAYVLENCTGDYKAINDAIQASTRDNNAIIKALATFKAEKSSGSATVQDAAKTAIVTCGKFTSGEESLTTTKNLVFSDISATGNGQKLFTIGSISIDSYKDSSLLNPKFSELSGRETDFDMYSKEYPLEVQGLRIKNIESSIPMFPVSVKEIYMDGSATDIVKVKIGFKEFAMPKAMLKMIPDTQMLAEMLPGDILADFDLDVFFDTTKEESVADIKILFSDKLLGRVDYAVDMVSSDKTLTVEELEEFEVKNVMLSYYNKDIEPVRKMLPQGSIEMLKMQQSKLEGENAKIAQAMLELLEKGGKVTFDFSPKKPVPFDEFMNSISRNPLQSDLTVKYEKP